MNNSNFHFGEDLRYYKYKHLNCNPLIDIHNKQFENKLKYYRNLSRIEFENEIDKFLKMFKGFVKVEKIKDFNVAGWYLIILGEYKQAYIGISWNIYKRIKQHWNKKILDITRYINNDLPIPIDAFEILDTTEIYVMEDVTYLNTIEMLKILHSQPELRPEKFTYLLEDNEIKMIKYFDHKFLCNLYDKSHPDWKIKHT